MRLLLDTHTLLWWLAEDATLSRNARETIADPANQIFVSAASAWEIAIKKAAGRLRAPDDLEEQIEHNRFTPLPISLQHTTTAGALPNHHRDPFDRMLMAQGKIEQLTIVTRDDHIPDYGVEVIRA